MTSPTKTNKVSKNNSDMLVLQETNPVLYQKLQTTLDFLSCADIKQFISDPTKLSNLMLSKDDIESIEKLLSNAKEDKIQTSLVLWQTELIFHYNRLLAQIKSQPYTVHIEFLKKNYAVDLMQLYPLTPRKRARIEARQKKNSELLTSEILQNAPTQLPHFKSSVAKKLRFDEDEGTKSESVIEVQTDKIGLAFRLN